MKKSSRLSYAVLASTLLVVPLARADLVVSTVLTDQDIKTSAQGDITITNNGQLAMTTNGVNNGDAILIDSADALITIDAGNLNADGNAILVTGTGRYGINIDATDAQINLGAGSAITSTTDDAIYVNNSGAEISSTGTISGDASAINVTTNGTNTTISLLAGSTTQGNTAPTISVNASGLSFGNSGTVLSVDQDAILLRESVSNFQNNALGIINTSGAGNAINLDNAAAGTINNSGFIGVDGTGSAISITNTFNGSIVNSLSGIIATSGGGGTAITVNAGFSEINNLGNILSLGTDKAIDVAADAAGTITNVGTVSADDASAITLGGNITGINNTGTIQNDSASATINVTGAGVNLINGILNKGTIVNFMGDAIDLSIGNNITLTQSAGSITGDVYLAGAGGDIFTISGGTITGDVHANSAAQNTLTLSGGVVIGDLLLGALGDTVNLSGTTIDSIIGSAGNDTVNITDGHILVALSGGGGADTLNIDNSYTSESTITDFQTINVNAGTFTVNNIILGLDSNLSIDFGAAMTANADISGTGNLTNDGTFYILNSSTTNLSGTSTNNGILAIDGGSALVTDAYIQTAGSVFSPILDSTTDYGVIQVGAGGADLQADSIIYPYYTSGNFIPAGTTMTIISGGPITDNSILAGPSSTTLYFTKSVVGNTLQLIAERNTYASVIQGIPPSMTGIADVLDEIAAEGTTDPTLLTVLGQLDTLPTASALENALINLSPNVNYALVQATHLAVNSVFNTIEFRIESLRHLKPLGAEDYVIYRPEPNYYTGMNYGDCDFADDVTGVWFDVYGSLLNQKYYKNVNGYYGDQVGYAIGADWGSVDSMIAGLALSYTNTHTVGNSMQANIVDVESIQGTAYAWYEPCQSIFLDVLFGFSQNKYYTRRNIAVGTFSTAAFGNFYGYQYAVQGDLGYAFTYDYLIVAPVGRFKYSYLGVDSYTEEGAAGVALSTSNNSLKELIGGGGIKLLGEKKYSQATYVPELSVMALYDFYGEGQELTSNFFGGGGLFPTDGPRPSHAIYLLSAGITAYTYDHYSFEIRYDLEIRDRYHYYGNSGFMQLRGEW